MKRSGKPSRPSEPHGDPVVGRISKLLVGQGYGFIALRGGREVYFHRSDVREGTAFNDLRVGDPVVCELFEDAVSGARALRVAPNRKRRS